ncbi:hypothetical protein FRC14_002254 [Serendipita sp. 396]|nr:hypothetical protein FRC14_002254 [Serendipita sp. 396]KAG8785106.1 hypothetical protein FRC15_001977 [Serendipita sp. 397]KAG8800722.1 hypothetical protein FRC16_002196 [Serendipita sp. 398]KAG8838699.1 hypothetical protein FRC18_003158 [Serendipita sp. 400]KAG8855237.1 hypothetical protein FRB91_002430 [Serendipita sp. 411]KAG8868948.1 hypothetical protein FRC20_002449 [Serendipita sp. 405]
MGRYEYNYILYWVIPVVVILPISLYYTTRGAISRMRLQNRLQRVTNSGHAVIWVPPSDTYELVEGDNKKDFLPLMRELNLGYCQRIYGFGSAYEGKSWPLPFGCSLRPAKPSQRTFTVKSEERENHSRQTVTRDIHVGMEKEFLQPLYLLILPGHPTDISFASLDCDFIRSV